MGLVTSYRTGSTRVARVHGYSNDEWSITMLDQISPSVSKMDIFLMRSSQFRCFVGGGHHQSHILLFWLRAAQVKRWKSSQTNRLVSQVCGGLLPNLEGSHARACTAAACVTRLTVITRFSLFLNLSKANLWKGIKYISICIVKPIFVSKGFKYFN